MKLSMWHHEVFVEGWQLSARKKISLIYCSKMCCFSLPRRKYVMLSNHTVEDEEQRQPSSILLFDFLEFKQDSYTIVLWSASTCRNKYLLSIAALHASGWTSILHAYTHIIWRVLQMNLSFYEIYLRSRKILFPGYHLEFIIQIDH